MGEVNMDTEDILAEPDEIQQNYLGLGMRKIKTLIILCTVPL